MESKVIMNAFHHVVWGAPISVYFWLVGASAGSFVISSLGWVFGVKRFKPLSMTASISAIILLLIVPIVLTWDLGKPWRFFYLMLPGYAHLTSPMTWGTFLIMAYPVAMIVYSFFIYKHNERWARVFGILAIALAVSTHWYTGVVMELNPGRYLNHTAMAPLLFLTGAFISGIGLLILIVWIRNMLVSLEKRIEWPLIEEMSRLMMYGIAFDMFLLFSEFMQATYGSADLNLGHHILTGVFGGAFVWLEIIIGLLIPFIILVTPLRRLKAMVLLASFLVTFGVYGMRVWWVLGGQYLQTFY